MWCRRDLAFTFPQVEERNYVDTLIDNKLKKLRIAPSGVCSDEEFLRRVTIDITGLLPTVPEHDSFLADPDPNKRANKIIKHDTFIDYDFFCDYRDSVLHEKNVFSEPTSCYLTNDQFGSKGVIGSLLQGQSPEP